MIRAAIVAALAAYSIFQIPAAGQSPRPGPPDRNRPGPWDNDIQVFQVSADGQARQLATFERAGVATVARLGDGRLLAAHQHFPEDNDADFDKVAVRFSQDEGTSWTPPAVIRLSGLAPDMRFPFDPTLVPLPDGRVRMYFTSVRRAPGELPAIHSAISADGVTYTVEPGVRFAIDGRSVIDCAVVLHGGVFHLFAPDNGPGLPPGAPPRPGEPAPRLPPPGTGYHATSADGLRFSRVDDVQVPGRRRWLGNALSDGGALIFVGTGEPGLWMATSADGRIWQIDPTIFRVPGADPGAVRRRDGSWLMVATGPPRRR
jgi:hypothetical protein